MTLLLRWAGRAARVVILLLLVILGSAALVRFAPGYLSDAREMDARYAAGARSELSLEESRSGSIQQIVTTELRSWSQGDLGISRQFGVRVSELIRPRLAVTGGLLLRSIIAGWCLALVFTLISSSRSNPSAVWRTPTTLLLAVPATAMATFCLLSDVGGPVAVMTLLVATRDHKFLHNVFRRAWLQPHLLQARAQGIRSFRLYWAHLLPEIWPECLTLATFSIVTVLGAIVPVEVIFGVPGVGQLAWGAAMNRDLPILLSITALMALCVVLAGMLAEDKDSWGLA